MSGLDIGLTGIYAARKGLEVVGNNIANSATEGYHRERINYTPGHTSFQDGFAWGTGVEVANVVRLVDDLLEQELLLQQSTGTQTEQELSTLKTIETTFGELTTGNSLSTTIDNFFTSVRDLSAHPDEVIWQRQLISAAEAMAFQFRTIGESLTTLKTRVVTEAETVITQINELSAKIAASNDEIQRVEVTGGVANNLRDQRDQRIADLSKLIGVTTYTKPFGVVDVIAGGVPVVLGKITTELELGNPTSSTIGIGTSGASSYSTNVSGGKLGALINLKNNLIQDIHTDLDTLAKTMVNLVNTYHVQGVGSDGSFSSKIGVLVPEHTALSDLDPPVTDGTVYVRVTHTGTGAVTRSAVTIDADDTLTAAATALNAVTGITSVTTNDGNKLQIEATTGYTFDFIPAPLPSPDTSSFASGSAPTVAVSGLYTESSNDILTCTIGVSGGGTQTIGNGAITIAISDGTTIIATLNVGSGYVAGQGINVGNGITLALSAGTLTDGDSFTVQALANSDTAGLLSTAGLNTFLFGATSQSMAVRADILEYPGALATALGSELADNNNALRIAALQDATQSDLNNLSVTEFYHSLVTEVGQDITTKTLHHENTESVLLNLNNRRNDISGVDINDEAAQMLIYEQMFQAMARYINTISKTLDTLVNLIG
jgi:flagellar hook-associated protein 1